MLDGITDGAEGVFDMALTNGLVAIVVHCWPDKAGTAGRMLSASQLLNVIENKGRRADGGVVRVLHDPAGPEFTEWPFDLGDGPSPNFTEVAADVLRDALDATQEVRHARALDHEAARVITDEHLNALEALDDHPALRSLLFVTIDRYEQRVDDAGEAEISRAQAYLEAIGEAEEERRAGLDYVALYAESDRKGMVLAEVEECPVCGHTSFVATGWEGQLGDLGIGHCVICSYQRTEAVADNEATLLRIQWAAERND
ncbi:hypothetical protein [Streptosporangium sandarakinum]|uniref:hypothetical protein n=1 Tax=Streptosporangium sandarakinum TaxID=1260955 RepID=UPI0036A62402